MPHRKTHVLADVAKGGPEHVEQAIAAANAAHHEWSRMPWHERAAVFLRAAELLAGPWRSTLNAATILNQSKTSHQAEIDAVCEMVDFWRYNVDYILRIYCRAAALADRDLEPDGVPAARGLRLRGQPVQLQLHRREPLLHAGAHGLHDRVEAGVDRRALGLLLHACAAGGRAARRRHQPRLRLGLDDRAARRSPARTSRGSTSPARPRSSTACGRPSGRTSRPGATAATRASSARPAGRTSSSRTRPPTPRPSRPRSCAARSSTRGRSAPPPRASTSRRTSGPRSRRSSSPTSRPSGWATPPTSRTSWAR